MDELQRQLEAFSKRYGTQGYLMKARIEILMKQGKSPEDAVRQVFREFGVEDWLQVNVAQVIVGTAQDALGKEAASTLSTAAILEALSNPWDGSGLTLSEKIHGASNVMLNDVITTLRAQIRRNKTVKDTAQALYDGYKSGHVVREQQLPQYLDELTRWTRRSRKNLSQEELKDLQRSIRKVRYQADDLVDDRSTYNHFRTSLRELMDKLEHGSEKAAQRALQNAIQEKSRYVAERIARTEAARARYDAFLARYGEDDSVAAYRWKLGSRHPAEDICDMYAHADLYGLGAGVFPKDQAPVNPAHPHCLCHYAPVYASELKGKKRSDNVEDRGNAWLKRQPLHIRQAILGVKGEQEWKAGRAGWMEKARNISPVFEKKESRLYRLMRRKKNNIEDFSGLGILMTVKSVKALCRKYNLKTHGILYKIQRDRNLVRQNYFGSADPKYVGRIDLFPLAFYNETELLRTIIHENCHVMQFKKYGPVYVQEHRVRMEKVAYRFEAFYFKIKTGGKNHEMAR